MIDIAFYVASRVTLRVTPEDAALEEALKALFTHANPEHANAKRLKLYRLPPTTISTWRWDDDPFRGSSYQVLSLPRGGLERAVRCAAGLGYRVRIEHNESDGDDELLGGGIPNHAQRVTLRGYQEEIVQAVLREPTCIVRAATASGKTTAAFAIVSRVNRPALVVVNNSGLRKQWQERCESELGLVGNDVGLIQGKTRRLRPITLAMAQTLAQDPEWCRANAHRFGLVIADEAHAFAADTIYASVDPFEARFRVGVSADERRPDGKEFMVEDLMGKVAIEVGSERLIAEGAVLPVTLYVVPTNFQATWFSGARARPQDFVRLQNEIADDKDRNAIIANLVAKDAVLGHTCVVWCARREQCHVVDADLAARGVLGGLLIGGADYAQRFDETRRGLRDGRLRAGVGTIKSMGTGQDIPALSRGVCAVPLAGNNRQQLVQCMGRLSRLGTKDAAIYYLWDRDVYGMRHLKNLAKWFPLTRVLINNGSDAPRLQELSVKEYEARHKGGSGVADDPTLAGIFDGH